MLLLIADEQVASGGGRKDRPAFDTKWMLAGIGFGAIGDFAMPELRNSYSASGLGSDTI